MGMIYTCTLDGCVSVCVCVCACVCLGVGGGGWGLNNAYEKKCTAII